MAKKETTEKKDLTQEKKEKVVKALTESADKFNEPLFF